MVAGFLYGSHPRSATISIDSSRRGRFRTRVLPSERHSFGSQMHRRYRHALSTAISLGDSRQPRSAITFKAREVADALPVTPHQLAQSIQHHRETPKTLVAIEQWSDGTHRSALWRATPCLSFARQHTEQASPSGDD